MRATLRSVLLLALVLTAMLPMGCARRARIDRNRSAAERNRAEADRARAEAEAIRAATAEEYYEGDEPPAPPANLSESRPASPGPTHVWVAGCHVWKAGRYVWVAGHWHLPPHRGAVWVPGHWDRRAARRHCWVAGHWR